VFFDNQVDVSIIHPTLLREIELAGEDVHINGVGGHQFTVGDTGYLDEFFRVYASTETHGSILSFAEVEDRFPITYVPRESFTVHLQDRDIVFNRRGKMYVADWEQERTAYVFTGVYTKAKELRAERAYDLLRTSGYPSMSEAVHLVEDGNIRGMPILTKEDIRRVYKIYGSPPEYEYGKMMKKKVSQAIMDENLMLDKKRQVLYSDVMHIDSNKFLIPVCKPLQLTIKNCIEREIQNN
jgi:hypothetical protein